MRVPEVVEEVRENSRHTMEMFAVFGDTYTRGWHLVVGSNWSKQYPNGRLCYALLGPLRESFPCLPNWIQVGEGRFNKPGDHHPNPKISELRHQGCALV